MKRRKKIYKGNSVSKSGREWENKKDKQKIVKQAKRNNDENG